MTSSFENPNTNASLLSMSVISYLVGNRLGQRRYQLETAEPRSQDYHVLTHKGQGNKARPRGYKREADVA